MAVGSGELAMSYRGPNTGRIAHQHAAIQRYHGETCTWWQFVSAENASGSAYYGGGGTTRYSAARTITGLFAAPQIGEARFREIQAPGGQYIVGDVIVSTPERLGTADTIDWRGTTYRVEGDATPINFNQRAWWRVVLRRGDATG
jgi:hypothetical protein